MASGLFAIEPTVRDYAWGSTTAIPTLRGETATGARIAELWFGAHTDSPALAPHGALDELIAADPVRALGAEVAAQFDGQLPFLLKVLAADRALSIQVHPTLAQARAGFADEQARGIALDAPNRNYRDPNHKPELLCALTEFDALCGFRPVEQTLQFLRELDVTELGPVVDALGDADPLRTAFELLLEWPASSRAALLAGVLEHCQRLSDGGGEWALAARASVLAAADFPGDIGVALALLLNAIRLHPGQAIFLGAGNVHAYVRGLGVEVMANSDNVLRCGLTPKHVDVAEVLRVADFSALREPRWPALPAESGPLGGVTFSVPVADFELSRLPFGLPANPFDALVDAQMPGPQIILCTEGEVTAVSPTTRLLLRAGQAAFGSAGEPIELSGAGTAFQASVGSHRPL
jgi:mannose-6-phosphate isomerase